MSRKKVHVEDEEDHFLSPTIDSFFKRIFADRRTTAPISSMLSGIFNTEVSEVLITNPEIPKDSADAKGNVLDINAILNGTMQVSIEIQVWHQTHFMKRTQFNLARLYETQIKSGGDYGDLQRTVVINILNESYYGLPPEKWHTTYLFKEDELNTPLPHGMMEIHFIELQKMQKLGAIDESDLLTKWVLFLNAKSLKEMEVIAKHEPAIWEAYMIVEEVLKNEEERRKFESRQKFIRDQLTNQREYERRVAAAEKKAVEAREEGIEIGEKKGIEIGEKKGIEIGEKRGLIEAAKKLISTGMDKKTVCEKLGISESDLT
jgi:predicted transposase/invertase (TIGR01784 family)